MHELACPFCIGVDAGLRGHVESAFCDTCGPPALQGFSSGFWEANPECSYQE